MTSVQIPSPPASPPPQQFLSEARAMSPSPRAPAPAPQGQLSTSGDLQPSKVSQQGPPPLVMAPSSPPIVTGPASGRGNVAVPLLQQPSGTVQQTITQGRQPLSSSYTVTT